jgi:hypothetical protein
VKITFDTEYEKLCFERLLDTVYESSDPGHNNFGADLADTLAALVVKIAGAVTSVEKPDYAQSIGTTSALALPASQYYDGDGA